MRELYKIVGLSEQAVIQYAKRNRKRSIVTLNLLKQIDDYRSRHPGCGLEKMYYQLNVQVMGRDKFISFAQEMGYQLAPHRSCIRTTISGSYSWPNLIEGLLLVDINSVWQSDITYFRVSERFYYITFIIDVYSRRIVGYAVSNTLESKANILALKKAFRLRGNNRQSSLIHHSDRGSQYTSKAYLALLTEHGATPSMGEKGQDNAYAERLNGIIKNEYLKYREIANMVQLKRWTKQAVNQYNGERIHNSLPGKISPVKFEQKLLTCNYQKRPKVIIYTDGNKTIRQAQGLLYSLPEKALQAHICPIINKNIIQKD